MGFKKDDFSSFEIQELDGTRLFFTDKHFDFPKMLDAEGNDVENVLVIKGLNLPEIGADRYIYVIALRRNGDILRFKTAVSVSSRFQINIYLNPQKAEEITDRRRYFKIRTDEKGYITFVEREQKIATMDPPVEINVRDINVGGIFFVFITPNIELIKDDKAMFIINLDGMRFELLLEVLRVQYLPDTNEIGYGCRFVNTTTAQEEALSRYVYKLQYELRQKQRKQDD